MDWLDQYLVELEKPVSTRYLPPDSHAWNKPNPSQQQKSIIEDSIVADLIRQRMIQEARQAEIEAGMGGGYDAGSSPAKEGPVITENQEPNQGLALFAILI